MAPHEGRTKEEAPWARHHCGSAGGLVVFLSPSNSRLNDMNDRHRHQSPDAGSDVTCGIGGRNFSTSAFDAVVRSSRRKKQANKHACVDRCGLLWAGTFWIGGRNRSVARLFGRGR